MKKFAATLCMFLCLITTMSPNALAYEGGILHGKPGIYTVNGSNVYTATDGNLSTYHTLKHGYDSCLVWTLDDIYNIQKIQWKISGGSSGINMIAYDSSGKQIGSYKAITNTENRERSQNVKWNNVARLVVCNIASGFSVNVYEFDAYGYAIGTPPPAPDGLKAQIEGTKIILTWNAVTGVPDLEGYNIYRDNKKINSTPIKVTTYNIDVPGKTAHSWYVTAIRSTGAESDRSNVVYTDFQPPAAPKNLQGTPGDGEVTLRWVKNTETDLAGYNIYRNGTKINTSLITVTEITIPAENGVKYTYTVTAVDTSGNESAHSNVVSLTAVDPPPAKPQNFKGTPGDKSVTLSWDANKETDLAGYRLYDGTKHIATIPKTQTTITLYDLVNGRTYTFRLTAYDTSGGESEYAEIKITPADNVPPAKPKNLNGAPGNGLVNLFWTANTEPDLAGYYIYQDGKKLSLPLSKDIYRTIKNLENGKSYVFQVSAVDYSGNESELSDPVTLTPDINADSTPPATPQGLVAAADRNRINASWQPNTDIDLLGYFVYLDGKRINYAPISANSYTIPNLDLGKYYSVSVSAIDNSGNESPLSDPVQVYVDIVRPPKNLKITKTENGVTLTWDAADEPPDYYVIYRNGYKIADTTDLTLSDSDLVQKQGYKYEVAAVKNGIESDRVSRSIYISDDAISFEDTDGFFDGLHDVVQTGFNFLKQYGLYILFILGVLFAPTIISFLAWLVRKISRISVKAKDDRSNRKKSGVGADGLTPQQRAAKTRKRNKAWDDKYDYLTRLGRIEERDRWAREVGYKTPEERRKERKTRAAMDTRETRDQRSARATRPPRGDRHGR